MWLEKKQGYALVRRWAQEAVMMLRWDWELEAMTVPRLPQEMVLRHFQLLQVKLVVQDLHLLRAQPLQVKLVL